VLTNFLRALIEKAPKEYLQSPEIVEFIQQGVTNRLSENISSQLHRKCGEVNNSFYELMFSLFGLLISRILGFLKP
jgi:hypothetical protein